jgi:divalent metal cation (Fe/Co/Zn/Cd) transporter
MHLSLKIAASSLAVSLAVLAIKYGAYLLTGSIALYSDALESIINVVTAAAAIVAIQSATRPADAEHPYGHHKAEYLSAVVVGVMIVVAAVAILREAYGAVLAPKPIDAPWIGLAVNTVATVINFAWSGVLIRQGRRHRSAALVADGKHLLVDVVTSLGVLVGVVLVVLTGIDVLDAAIAALVALHVLRSGWATASASHHDDLAARRQNARERLNVRTVCDDKKDSAPGPLVDDCTRAGDQGLSLVSQHHHIAECRLGFDRSQVQQRGRIHATTPRQLRILSTAIPSDLSRAPIVAASTRPLVLRLR